MGKILYHQEFFSSKRDAEQFMKILGCGVLYSNTPRSRSRKQFLVEAAMSGYTETDLKDKNYCVAWNQQLH